MACVTLTGGATWFFFNFCSGLVAWPGWVPAQPIVLCTLVNARMDTSNFVDLSCKPDIGIIDPELSVPNTSIFEKKNETVWEGSHKNSFTCEVEIQN